MHSGVLITTFATWLPHQASNASDDLLQHFIDANGDACHTLRHLPVDPQRAPRMVLDAFETLRPRVLVCCGMAEERARLELESQARLGESILRTDLNLAALAEGLALTAISNDAGDFVCNTLYYRSLERMRGAAGAHHCLFIHVPVLTDANTPPLTEAFTQIISRLSALR
ncbi:pyroglutamyl-peptidase I family protein [Thiomicrolovo sp. ZZH C-3]